MSLADRWRLEIEHLKAAGRYRVLQALAGIDFSSNDYLGYSKRALPVGDLPHSGTASRLLRGEHPIWEEVEAKLARWHRAESALVMTSGYAANEGLLSTIIAPDDVVFSDQCNHASIIDGLRLSRAEKVVFAHNDLNEFESRLRQRMLTRTGSQAWFVVTESLFGMEGDLAPLRQLADLTERYQAHLIVDEAHATGCFGVNGSGLVDSLGLRERVLATVHTGGKALAVPGAYVVGSRLLKEMLVNRCRHFIYTTALPPIIGAWWMDTIDTVEADDDARRTLRERTRFFRAELANRGIDGAGTEYVVSIVLGQDHAAIESARRLQQASFDVRAIRPPTVPDGTARLRISIHADHEPAVLERLADRLGALAPSDSCAPHKTCK